MRSLRLLVLRVFPLAAVLATVLAHERPQQRTRSGSRERSRWREPLEVRISHTHGLAAGHRGVRAGLCATSPEGSPGATVGPTSAHPGG